MELRNIGMILICASTLWMFIRFFQVGLERKYWVKKGVFRWHLIPGTMLVWMSPYFAYSLWQIRVPNLWVATLAGALGLILCVTGFRMLVLLNRKDTRMKRWFALLIFVIAIVPLQTLSALCVLNKSGLFITLGRTIAVASLLCSVFSTFIVLMALPSHFTANRALDGPHFDEGRMPNFSWRNLFELLQPKTNPESRMYSVVGDSGFGRFLVWLFGDFLNIPAIFAGIVISFMIIVLPSSTLLTSGLRSIEFLVAVNSYAISGVVWSMFEMTLFSRGYHTKMESWLSILLGFVAPLSATFCFYPSWFGTDFVTAFFRMLFLHLPPG